MAHTEATSPGADGLPSWAGQGTLVDLSMPVGPHWRFAAQLTHREHLSAGCAFHSTEVRMAAHAFTHVDAPWHVLDDGPALGEVELDRLWGDVTVIDVSDLGPEAALDDTALRERAGPGDGGGLVLLRSDHERRFPTSEAGYWTRSPYVTRSGAEWLRTQTPKAVGFDFPQDRAIRSAYLADFVPHPGGVEQDWACHRLLLAAGVPQIEYLTNLAQLPARGAVFFALPLRLEHSDGAPVRAFAVVPGGGDR